MGMFNQNNFDLHYAAYVARTTKVDRDGWMMEDLASSGAAQVRRSETFVQRMRRLFGKTLVGIGERIQGTRAAHASTPAMERYGPAI
jgi:hypothetical protein